jgi:hypothetical protein
MEYLVTRESKRPQESFSEARFTRGVGLLGIPLIFKFMFVLQNRPES